MISNLAAVIFALTLVLLSLFIWNSVRSGTLDLLHRLYLFMAGAYCIWIIALLIMKFTDRSNESLLFVLDACTNGAAAFMPPLSLAIALGFVKGWEKWPRKYNVLFIIPILTNVVVWTNPIHHLQYQVFSVIKSEVVFGPYIMVSGIYSYICLTVGMILVISFAVRNQSNLYRLQCLMFCLGALIPLIVSIQATFFTNLSIAATPLSFVTTILFNGIAIYRLHLLDIRPMATQRVLDWISDCYMVLSDKGLVISYNVPFAQVFAERFGVQENKYLHDCVKEEDVVQKTAIYNLLTALESCRESRSTISFEQSLTITDEAGKIQKNYYIADVTSLVDKQRLYGFVVIYKDVTQLKKSMQQLQENQRRMMEQERLAFLGQMIGGLAHNLKTPIMSISGCAQASEALVDEIRESMGDTKVTREDYEQICNELSGWFDKIREATAYMSDIISAIKGQAANVSSYYDDGSFTTEEMFKRIMLLMRHELLSGSCRLVVQCDETKDYIIHGDINNMVQVLINLISNAIYAERGGGGGDVTVSVEENRQHLDILVRDTGPGVDPVVREKLFKEMVTNKGSQGTGLGLYISNAVIRGKFGGEMWIEDNPGGGAVFGISLPAEQVTVRRREERQEAEA